MTADEARTFRHGERIGSIMRLALMTQARKDAGQHPTDFGCEPYSDFYTMRRWRALDRSIRKGCRSFPLPTILDDDEPGATDETDTEPKRRRPKFWTARVFCRCMTCEPGTQADHPWPWIVDDETRQAERARKVSVDPDDADTLANTAQALLESGDLERSAA